MDVRVYGRSDVGRVRSNNEDSLLLGWPAVPGVGVFVVADGVGGEKHGDVASEMFAREVGRRITQVGQEFGGYSASGAKDNRERLLRLLASTTEQVNRRIHTLAQQDPELTGMCTTGVTMVLTREGVFVAHAGDSRGYLVRGEQVYQLTEDHTLANQLLKKGLLKASSLDDFPYSHVITRSFGSKDEIEVDTIFIEPAPGDRFVLCTDGVHNYIDGDELREFSGRFTEPEHLVEHLIQEANARGGSDNLTAVVVEIGAFERDDETAIDLERKLDFMRRLFLFKDLTDEELIRVMQSVYSVRKSKGEYIIHEGSSGEELYIVIEGLVDVLLEGRYLTSIAPGGHCGEMALIDDHFRSASVVAKTDVLLLTIRRDDFIALIENEHELVKKLLWAFLENMAGRVRDLSCEIVDLNGQLNALKRGR